MKARGRKGWRWAIALAAVAAGIWAWRHFAGAPEKPDTPAIYVSVEAASRKDMPLVLHNVGTVVTYQSVGVRSRLDSQIMEVKFRDGDSVQQGDLLFVLDDRTLKAQLRQALADLERDRAQLTNLRRQYERNRALAAKEYASKSELDDARAAYAAQEATVLASEAAVKNINVQLGYTQITAPISGRTGTIAITVGNTVKANDTPLVTINQTKPIRVQVALPQQYLDQVRSAMHMGRVTVTARQQNSDVQAEGMLEYVDNTIDQATGTFAARASFPNEAESLWPGMFVDVALTLGVEERALVVPEVAVQHGQQGDYLYVVENEKAMKRNVKVDRMQDDVAVIREGIQEGEQVVTDGVLSLKEGSAVTLQAPGAKGVKNNSDSKEKKKE